MTCTFRRNRIALSVLCAAAVAASASALDTTLISTGSTWSYLADGSDQGSAWQAVGFDDSLWATGPAQLGYGDGDEATVVTYGPDANNKYVTTYFRHGFTVANPASIVRLDLRLLRDDGAVVYLNGTEAYRTNMPSGPVTAATLASSAIGGSDENQFLEGSLDPQLLVSGTNVMAVEIHQSSGNSSDISFDLDLVGSDSLVRATRGPYWQLGTPTSMVVRWRSNPAANSRVRYGSAPGQLTTMVDDATVTTEHAVTVSGLMPDTTYYYAIGTTTDVLAGDDADHFVVTPPTRGTIKDTRIWVIGDSGTANNDARAVRDAYTAFTGSRHTDLWLMLGDNAYESGTDAEYQAAVFDMYPQQLQTTVLWPTFGNHDALSASAGTQSGPYYDIFTLPTLGQAGGAASGTEAYYSFDYANMHFICLDSQESSRQPGSAMLTWLEADLQATDAQWIIAFWHHPPYSKGSHNSDTESQLIEMRQNVLPILENYGVDLVLTGHSHSYERSFLLDGHYGLSSTLMPSMLKDSGDGRTDGDGAYHKSTLGTAAHEGAVYVVAGSSGQTSGGALNHPVMYTSLNELGSLVLDVNGSVLNATFLNSAGTTRDHFTLAKGSGLCPAAPRGGCRTAKRSSLRISNQPTDRYDRVGWTWLHGQSTALSEFGDPTATTNYALCVYANGGLALEVPIPAASFWSRFRQLSFTYHDRAATHSGVRTASLRSSATDYARIRVLASGAHTPEPALPLLLPVTAQVVNSDTAVCWEGTYTAPDVKWSSATRFRALAIRP